MSLTTQVMDRGGKNHEDRSRMTEDRKKTVVAKGLSRPAFLLLGRDWPADSSFCPLLLLTSAPETFREQQHSHKASFWAGLWLGIIDAIIQNA